jgi:single stranded DNA-binding protein
VNATEITVIGNVVNSPTRKRTQNGSVTNFRVAATERRFDGGKQEWVDGHTFFIDVDCWGELGGNVSHSISKGDPVVVVGAIRTDEWDTDTGRRSRPQIKAEAVAHNLARGVGDFRRTQRSTAGASAEPGSSEDVSEAVPSDESDEFGGLVAGRDYETDPSTLHDADADDLTREPVHV